MEEADSGESGPRIDPEHSEERAQRDRDSPGSREDSLPAGEMPSEVEQAMSAGTESKRDESLDEAPFAPINPITQSSSTKTKSGKDPLLQSARKGSADGESDRASSDSGDSGIRGMGYAGASPRSDTRRKSVELFPKANEERASRRRAGGTAPPRKDPECPLVPIRQKVLID